MRKVMTITSMTDKNGLKVYKTREATFWESIKIILTDKIGRVVKRFRK